MNWEEFLARWEEYRMTGKFPELPHFSLPRRRETFKRAGLVLGGLAALAVAGYGVYRVVDAPGSVMSTVFGSSLDDYLPEGWQGLEFGMSLEEVKNIRSFIEPKKEGEAGEALSEQSLETFGQLWFGSLTQGEFYQQEPRWDEIYRRWADAGKQTVGQLATLFEVTNPLAKDFTRNFNRQWADYFFDKEGLWAIDLVFGRLNCPASDDYWYRRLQFFAEQKFPGTGRTGDNIIKIPADGLSANMFIDKDYEMRGFCYFHYRLEREGEK